MHTVLDITHAILKHFPDIEEDWYRFIDDWESLEQINKPQNEIKHYPFKLSLSVLTSYTLKQIDLYPDSEPTIENIFLFIEKCLRESSNDIVYDIKLGYLDEIIYSALNNPSQKNIINTYAGPLTYKYLIEIYALYSRSNKPFWPKIQDSMAFSSHHNVMSILLSSFPEFWIFWKNHINSWKAGSLIEPNHPGIELEAFAKYTLILLENNYSELSVLNQIFIKIDQLLQNEKSYLSYYIKRYYLEYIYYFASHTKLWKKIKKSLQHYSLQYINQLESFLNSHHQTNSPLTPLDCFSQDHFHFFRFSEIEKKNWVLETHFPKDILMEKHVTYENFIKKWLEINMKNVFIPKKHKKSLETLHKTLAHHRKNIIIKTSLESS